MDEKELAFQYVCTLEEAKKIVQQRDEFWVSNCECRESRLPCKRSRIDVCLQFREQTPASGPSKRKISRAEVEEIFKEAKEKHLVTRPFRNEKNMTETDGICFCCDDCCYYFVNPDEKCDKGDLIEKTDSEKCTNCGTCVKTCYFKARKFEDKKLTINQDNCYGCGFCADVCPENAIQMLPRK